MADMQKHLDAAVDRLEELRAYRNQYATDQRPLSGAGAMQWQDFHRFMQRLDQAVMTQESIVNEGRIQREAHQKRWMTKRQRLKTLSRVVDRFKTEEAEAEERRQQKLQDAIPRQPLPYDR